jgi:hypothetical protein
MLPADTGIPYRFLHPVQEARDELLAGGEQLPGAPDR